MLLLKLSKKLKNCHQSGYAGELHPCVLTAPCRKVTLHRALPVSTSQFNYFTDAKTQCGKKPGVSLFYYLSQLMPGIRAVMIYPGHACVKPGKTGHQEQCLNISPFNLCNYSITTAGTVFSNSFFVLY